MRDMVLNDWRGILGSVVLDYQGDGVRRVHLDLVSEGCSVVVSNAGNTHLVACGSGAMQVAFVVEGDFALAIEGFEPDARTSVRIPHERLVETGWADGFTFVQLDLKSADDVTPEVRRMMDRMQRNALLREQSLRDEMLRLRREITK